MMAVGPEPLVYLASAYSHPDPAVRMQRYEAACRAAAWLFHKGLLVYSPIAHSHGVSLHGGLDGTWRFWERYDRAMLERSDCLIVWTAIDGWSSSVGVLAEIATAHSELRLPVIYATQWLLQSEQFPELLRADMLRARDRRGREKWRTHRCPGGSGWKA